MISRICDHNHGPIKRLLDELGVCQGNQQDVLVVLIRQTQRAQEDAKGIRVYIQKEAEKPQKPLQGWDKTPDRYHDNHRVPSLATMPPSLHFCFECVEWVVTAQRWEAHC